jgi:hypothetical protein
MRKQKTFRDFESGIQPVFLTTGETCRYLNISNSTLKRLGFVEALEPVNFSRERRYRRNEVEAFAALGKEKLLMIADRLGKWSKAAKARTARHHQQKHLTRRR